MTNKKNNNFFLRPDIILCVPYGITEVERIAALDAALEAGADDFEKSLFPEK